MAYKATASLNNLTFTNYVDFGKCQNRFGRVLSFKNLSTYLKVKLKVLKQR